jgi:hypothetical protein
MSVGAGEDRSRVPCVSCVVLICEGESRLRRADGTVVGGFLADRCEGCWSGQIESYGVRLDRKGSG